jgi:hypothetical protein
MLGRRNLNRLGSLPVIDPPSAQHWHRHELDACEALLARAHRPNTSSPWPQEWAGRRAELVECFQACAQAAVPTPLVSEKVVICSALSQALMGVRPVI